MELIVTQSLAGEAVGRRHTHRSTEGARHAEAHVVDEDDEHVRRTGRRRDLEARWRLGVAGVEHCAARVVRLSNGKLRPVELVIPGLRRSLRSEGPAECEAGESEDSFGVHNDQTRWLKLRRVDDLKAKALWLWDLGPTSQGCEIECARSLG